jgi:colanic acid/amylovoran biosynthesis glycosyltransferase
MNIAYLVNQYPKTSHSFVRREIVALEQLGIRVLRYTLRHAAEGLVDLSDRKELLLTSAVLTRPIWSKVIYVFRALIFNPLLFLTTLIFALRLGLRSDRSVLVHFFYFLEAVVVAAWCRRDKIDHLHVHFGTNSATVGMLVNRLIAIPWSFTCHGPEEFDRPLGISLIEKIKSADFVVAISSFGRSQLWRWAAHAYWKKIQVVRCGLDAAFLEGKTTPPPGNRRLICVGRLCEQKGQLLLVEAAVLLKDKNIDFEIVLAGDGPMRQEIEATINSGGLEDRVTITGWLSGERVRQELERAQALVLPSFAEGLPVVIMEAMVLERPVISTSIAGIPELVIPGKTGWLVLAGDVVGLADAIMEALSTPPHVMSEMGRNGRLRVLQNHNAQFEALKLKKLFEKQNA